LCRAACDSHRCFVIDRLLLFPGADVTVFNHEPMRNAIVRRNVRIVERLLQVEGAYTSADFVAFLHLACANHGAVIVDCLLRNTNVAQQGVPFHEAIIHASYHGEVRIVERLLQEPTMDPNVHDHAAVRAAKERGHDQVHACLCRNVRVVVSALFGDCP